MQRYWDDPFTGGDKRRLQILSSVTEQGSIKTSIYRCIQNPNWEINGDFCHGNQCCVLHFKNTLFCNYYLNQVLLILKEVDPITFSFLFPSFIICCQYIIAYHIECQCLARLYYYSIAMSCNKNILTLIINHIFY